MLHYYNNDDLFLLYYYKLTYLSGIFHDNLDINILSIILF